MRKTHTPIPPCGICLSQEGIEHTPTSLCSATPLKRGIIEGILIMLMVILLSIIGFAQTKWIIGEDILSSNSNGYWISNSDSIFFDEDTLYIAGAETLEVYANVGKTLGMITWEGTVQNKDTIGYSSTGDTVYFDCALHRGTGSARNSNMTETFYAIDSVKTVSDSVGSFNVYPLSNTTLDDQAKPFITLRIRGVANKISAIWIKESRVDAY